jgi:3-phenylpropionate/trans-cinnamate dioxygenase ferredoxin reductase component
VIGASLAGLSAARALRAHGFDGRLVIVGEERDRPYDRPPLSKQLLAGEWTVDQVQLPLDEGALAAEWLLGRRAVSLDAARLIVGLDGGGEEQFDGIVIASGAVARSLHEWPRAGVHVLRTLSNCLELAADLRAGPRRVAIVGAGFIGSEVASTCRRLGLAVTVVEALTVPLQNVLGHEVGELMAELHRDHEVDLRLGVTVTGIEGEKRVTGLLLSDGSRIDADVVVVAVGVDPATDWLEDSSLLLQGGVLCDQTCLAAPGIVAAGDVARWPNRRYNEVRRVEHWENAIKQGEHAARRLLAELGEHPVEAYAPVPWFWSDQYDRKLQVVGSPTGFDEVKVVSGSFGERQFVALYRREDRLIAAVAMNSGRLATRYRRLLETDPLWDDALAAARG